MIAARAASMPRTLKIFMQLFEYVLVKINTVDSLEVDTVSLEHSFFAFLHPDAVFCNVDSILLCEEDTFDALDTTETDRIEHGVLCWRNMSSSMEFLVFARKCICVFLTQGVVSTDHNQVLLKFIHSVDNICWLEIGRLPRSPNVSIV